MATTEVNPSTDCMNDLGCVSLKADLMGTSFIARWQRRIYNFFIPRGHHIIQAFVTTTVADDPSVLSRVRMQRVILRIEKYIASLPFFYFLFAKFCLYLMEYAIPPLSWKLRPFSHLSAEKRLAYLEEWQGSKYYPKRIIFKIVAAMCVSHLYSETRLLISMSFKSAMQNRLAHHTRSDHPVGVKINAH